MSRRHNSTLPRGARRREDYDATQRFASEENLEEAGKWSMLSKNFKHAVADFFGVAEDEESDPDYTKRKWESRSIKMHSKNTILGKAIGRGALHDTRMEEPLVEEPGMEGEAMEMRSPVKYEGQRGEGQRGGSQRGERQRGGSQRGEGQRGEVSLYAEASAAPLGEGIEDVTDSAIKRDESSVEIRRPHRHISWAGKSPASRSSYSKLVRKPSASVGGAPVWEAAPPVYVKDDVWKMALGGMMKKLSTRSQPASRTPRHKSMRSVPRYQISQAATLPSSYRHRGELDSLPTVDEVDTSKLAPQLDDISFFDSPQATSPRAVTIRTSARRLPKRSLTMPAAASADLHPEGRRVRGRMETEREREERIDDDDVDATLVTGGAYDRDVPDVGLLRDERKQIKPVAPTAIGFPSESPPDYERLDEDEGDGFGDGMKRIPKTLLTEIVRNGPKRRLGEGITGFVLGWERRSLSGLDPDVYKQLDAIETDMHRPYFTYWVTFVQIVCFIVAVCVSGISTIGVHKTIIRGEVLTTSLTTEYVERTEFDNMWIGPRQADLIHLGARYTLCMRPDINLEQRLQADIERERQTACCVRNDGSGAVQTLQHKCSSTLSTWIKWNGSNSTQNRHSGSVCGQDPRLCTNPLSQGSFEWKDDITEWPICKETPSNPPKKEEFRNMAYDVVGRPCCIGIQGQCVIVTREHCTFLRGYFHEEAALCSQVKCLDEICGMIPFWNPDVPDQFYRLWTSLFIHAGVIELVLTIIVQIFIMRDLEKLAGWLRICIIYVVSGMGGSLASALLVPYHVEAGPSGCQFGLLACLLVEVIHSWRLISSPAWALGKLICVTLICLILGFLPLVDNIAHVFGFIFGFLLSFALLPYVTFNVVDRRGKIMGIAFCLTFCVVLFTTLVLVFYLAPVRSCYVCQYFNCIPFTPSFCSNAEVQIVRSDV